MQELNIFYVYQYKAVRHDSRSPSWNPGIFVPILAVLPFPFAPPFRAHFVNHMRSNAFVSTILFHRILAHYYILLFSIS